MRTTINIDGHLLAAAKDAARESGITLGEYVERALRRERSAQPDPHDDPPLPVHHGKLLIPLGSMSNREIQEFLDEGLPPDKRR